MTQRLGVPAFESIRGPATPAFFVPRFTGNVNDMLEYLGHPYDEAALEDDPARWVFRKGPSDPLAARSHHVHLTRFGGLYWRRVLAFRDT